MNLSPMMMLAQLRSAAAYAFGRGQPADLFVIDRPSFWQAIWGGWIIHIVATSFATTFISPVTFAKISLVALVSSVGYVLLVSFLMKRIEKEDRFLAFIIPYLWLTAFQAMLFGAIALIVLMMPHSNFHLAVIPVVIWILYRTWRLIRDEMRISGGLAVGFILARNMLDGVINIAAGDILPIS